MQFSQLIRGEAARGELEFTLVTGETVRAGTRLVLGAAEATALERAFNFAVRRKVPEDKARPGNSIWELGYSVAVITLGLVDVDDPEGKRAFFDGGEEQVLQHLDPDRIALLYERHRAFQDRSSPRATGMTADQFYAKVVELAQAEDDDDRPFDSLRPATHRSFTRTLARQHWTLLLAKSPDGSPSGESTTDSTAGGLQPTPTTSETS